MGLGLPVGSVLVVITVVVLVQYLNELVGDMLLKVGVNVIIWVRVK